MTFKNLRLYHYFKDEDKIKKFKQIEKCREYANMFFDCLNNHITPDIIDVSSNCGKQYYILNECIKNIS